MAGTVVYLASRAGGYAHGQEIVIDGGFTAANPSRSWGQSPEIQTSQTWIMIDAWSITTLDRRYISNVHHSHNSLAQNCNKKLRSVYVAVQSNLQLCIKTDSSIGRMTRSKFVLTLSRYTPYEGDRLIINWVSVVHEVCLRETRYTHHDLWLTFRVNFRCWTYNWMAYKSLYSESQ